MNNREYALLAAKVLDSKKATDITVIDIMEKASFADYMVIATGNSDRQVYSLVDDVEDAFAKEGLFVKSIDGKQNSGWVLMDFGDIVVTGFSELSGFSEIFGAVVSAGAGCGFAGAVLAGCTLAAGWAGCGSVHSGKPMMQGHSRR